MQLSATLCALADDEANLNLDERIARLEEACAAYEAAAGLHAKQNTPANAARYQDTQQLLGECKERVYDLKKCKMAEHLHSRRSTHAERSRR
mmetsp:Transcript_14189/g.30358  ORF Transcript_14189/g.30358 Transcript_14189/m.30358 type:complete len:92 (-) Transcript_14189:394-669(-)